MIRRVTSEIPFRYHLGDVNERIETRLADELECYCSEEGFVLPHSVSMIQRSAPYYDRLENGGILRVIVKYMSDVVTLSPGSVVRVKITNMNRIGGQGVYVVKDTEVASVKLPFDLQDDSVKDLMIRDHYVDVQILMSEYGVGYQKINAVGRVCPASEPEPDTCEGDW